MIQRKENMSLMSNKSPNLVRNLTLDLLMSVVALGERVSPTDIEEGMRVGVDRQKYSIQLPLPPKIDPSVTMMQVEDKPDVTYSDVGGCKEQIERLREVVEVPLLSVCRDA
jgi:ATP-dependent 26S proteasome regulatory subunit